MLNEEPQEIILRAWLETERQRAACASEKAGTIYYLGPLGFRKMNR